MADYTKVVAWQDKDSLADSNTAKIISGSDFHTEFSAIETAVNTKADINGDAGESFAATTASPGTNTSQVATTAFVTAAMAKATINDLVYPVGSIYTSVGSSATTPTEVNTLLGVGTWVAFGAGKVPVGIDASDTDFDVIKETGGSKTHTLTTAELPAHNHSASGGGSGTDSGNANYPNGGVALYNSTSNTWNNITIGNTGNGDAHNNLQPYVVVYMWERTA